MNRAGRPARSSGRGRNTGRGRAKSSEPDHNFGVKFDSTIASGAQCSSDSSRHTSSQFQNRGRGGQCRNRGRGRGGKTSASTSHAKHNSIDSSDIDDATASFTQLSMSDGTRRKGDTRPTSRSGYGQRKSSQDMKEAGFKRTTIPQFLQLYDAEPNTIAGELLHDLKSFQKVILNSERVGGKREDMIKILGILFKLTRVDPEEKGKANRVLAEAFNQRSSQFCFKLQQYVQTITTDKEIKLVTALFEATLQLMPSSWEFLPIENLKNAIAMYAPSLKIDATYMSMIFIYKDAQKNAIAEERVVVSKKQDYSEYRSITILPSTSEINEMMPPKLRPNIVEGRYNNWEHYYDTQFKLLKEDFVAPLRRGVCGFREGLRGRDISDVRVYYDVIFTGLIFSADGILLSVQFDSSKLHRVNWEHSKRLIFGSLLCFSCNNFGTVMFASVVDRDAKKLREGKLTVKMECTSDILSLASSKDDYYTMIESQAHYETYYHILHSLQKAEFDIMPFTEILIESKCSEVQPPQYMCLTEDTKIEHPHPVFNMKNALGMTDQPPRRTSLFAIRQLFGASSLHSFDVSRSECWPSVDQVQLDQSQLKAMKMALTQKVSVIQGPPGTGKTYIGMKIVQALLTNRNIWDPARNSPLLVVCYTNHALDQFLEGIIDLSYSEERDDSCKFSIVRIGGRCQNEKVAKFSIKNLELRKPKVPRAVHLATREIKERVRRIGTNLDHHFKIAQQKVKPPLHELIEFVAPLHRLQICSLVRGFDMRLIDDSDTVVHGIKLWLSCQDIKEREAAHQASMKANGKSTRGSASSSDSEEEIDKDNKVTSASGETGQDSLIMAKEVSPPPAVTSTPVTDNDAINEILKQKLLAEKTTDDTPTNPEVSKNTASGNEVESSSGDDDTPPTESDDEDIEDTINVVGEAEIAEAHRMVDQPATIFEYKENANSNDDIEIPEVETSPPTEIFMSFPKGPFAYSTVSAIDDVFKLSKSDRWRLYDYWRGQYVEKLYNQLRVRFKEYLDQCEQCKTAKQEEDFNVLEKVDLIGMTTTGAAKYQHIIQRVKPKIVVVEEAAEVMECHIVSCLTAATQQLILIGDHKQLRPNPNEYYLARDYNLDISLFERLIRVGIPHAMLQIQHRMRPEIAGLVCPFIYPTLLNHDSVLQYDDVQGVTTNMYFFDHKYPEAVNDDLRSHSNVEEAKLVVGLCEYFLKQDYSPSQITVLTTYTGQLLKLKPLMPKNKFEGVRITAVDNFQGEENDIIILSLVRSNNNGSVGFLKIQNRICVALSRAKKGFYCFGNFTLLRDSCDTWRDILRYLKSKQKLGSSLVLCCSNHPDVRTEICTVDDFKKVPEGGCYKMCNARLECGHVCKLHCHPKDPFHINYECKQRCAKICGNGHPCPKLCYEPCPACRVKVNKVIPGCGHIQKVTCHIDPDDFSCKAPCAKKCSQGHLCTKLCSEDCGKCTTVVQKVLPKCGHLQDTYCYMDPNLCECIHPCERICHTNPSNPHRCKKLCYLLCGNCKEKVVKILPQCGHKQLVACHRDPHTHTCQASCEKKLPCRHPCTNKCGEPCTTQCMMKVEKKFPNCGHTTIQPCSKPISEVFCQEVVYRVLPCDHKVAMKCSKSVDNIKCKAPVEVVLKCGHVFKGKCHNQNEKCTVLTEKIQKCGHKMKLPCHESLPAKCTVKCTVKLLCGHQCTGSCSECYEGRMHKACTFQMFPLPCGHPTKESCSSLVFPVCDYKCEYSCAHRKVCTHNCSQPCNPCKERCSWICPHFECSKECHENCDRPRCNEPCEIILQCKHPCIGICGEPCPRVCRICKKQKKKFQNLCVGKPDTSSHTRYIQLSCDHLFEVNKLDHLLDGQLKDSKAVGPLVCPSCRKQIHSSHRYGNLIKQKRDIIERLHAAISNNLASTKQQDAFIEKVLSNFLPSHLLLKAAHGSHDVLVLLLQKNSKYLPTIFKKLPTLLSQPCTSKTLSILENEINQYVLIKGYESLCINDPELLILFQQLLVFFKTTPPSAQKNLDTYCERQRIFLLWMIVKLDKVVLPSNKDHNILKQLKERIVNNQPKLTPPDVSAHFDELQNVAQRARKRFTIADNSLKPTRASFISGIWTVCPNGHVYCEPRGLINLDKEMWGCPDCP